MDDLRPLLLLISGLFAAVVGGIFFAFSSFVMRALARVPPSQGIHAMQSINVPLNERLASVAVAVAFLLAALRGAC